MSTRASVCLCVAWLICRLTSNANTFNRFSCVLLGWATCASYGQSRQFNCNSASNMYIGHSVTDSHSNSTPHTDRSFQYKFKIIANGIHLSLTAARYRHQMHVWHLLRSFAKPKLFSNTHKGRKNKFFCHLALTQ